MTDLSDMETTPQAPGSAATLPGGEGTRRPGERGQGMVEYAFVLILIAMVVLIAVQVLGHSANDLYANVSTGLTTASGH